MELLFEFIFDIYLELMMYIVPEKRTRRKNTEPLQLLLPV